MHAWGNVTNHRNKKKMHARERADAPAYISIPHLPVAARELLAKMLLQIANEQDAASVPHHQLS